MPPPRTNDEEFRVVDVQIGAQDLTGERIERIYAKASPRFAVYHTGSRVSVQYADDLAVATVQRKLMATLNGLRTQIDGLIDGWRGSRIEQFRAKARRYDARVAAALILCLEDDGDSAAAALNSISDDIRAERVSWGRFEYLISASLVTLFAIFVFFLINRWWFFRLYFSPQPSHLWLGAKAGTVGAFFSIALAMRTRTVLPDLRRRDNIADGVLRILIGAIAGGVTMLMIDSHMLPPDFAIGTAKIAGNQENGWELLLVVAFIAGFVERLLPNLLEKTATPGNGAPPPTAPSQTPPRPPPGPTLVVTGVTKAGGPSGSAAGIAAGLVRLIVHGSAISRAASFAILYPAAGGPSGAQTRIAIALAQLAPPGGVVADPADQDGNPTLFRRLTIDIASVPPSGSPPTWWTDPLPAAGQRSLVVVNPDGQQVACPF